MNAKTTTATVVALSLFFVILILIFKDELVPIITFGAVAVIGVALTGGVMLASIYIYIAIEKALTTRAKRRAAERDSEFAAITTTDGQVHIRETNKKADWRPAHLDPRTYANSPETYKPAEPNQVELWRLWNQPKTQTKVIEGQYQLQQPEQPQLDLLTIMTQSTQSYAFIGGQQVGKTYQARKVASHWAGRGIKPVVIGPKWDKGEWDDCYKVGGEYDFNKVLIGMNRVKCLAQKRHADSRYSHKEHPIQPIFFDDWTAIRAKLDKEAEAFIVDATTLYASVNIILYFIIHLDTANAWGVGKIGAALKNNFVKLFIEPGFNEAGIIDRSKNIGWIQMPGQATKDRQQVQLFNEYGLQPVSVTPDLVIQPQKDNRVDLRTEVEVLRRLQNGESPTSVADSLFGHGGYQLQKVKDIIEKYR